MEQAGYHGVKINDFAQSVNMGNVGHVSIGLFRDTLKYVRIAGEEDAVHDELVFELREVI